SPHAAQVQELLIALDPRLLKPEALAPHQQQGDDIAEVQPAWVRLALQTLETVEEEIVVDAWTAALGVRGDRVHPEAERPGRWPLPDVAAVIAPDELGALVEQGGVDLLARTQLTAADGAATGVRLDLVLHPWPSRFSVRMASRTILSYRRAPSGSKPSGISAE